MRRDALRTLDDLGMEGEPARALRELVPASPTAPSWSPARPAPASRRPSTPPSRTSTTWTSTSSRSRIPSSTGCTGVNQIGVHRKAGLTFATGLRSVLRADPDVIMVGEVRDSETARIGIEAALTGHMVLTTLHTNDAPGAITRLQEMGIESFLTSSAIECVVAQRLARVLCPHCKRRVGRSAKASLGRGRLPGRHRPRGLRAGRLPALPRHRLPGPDGDLLGDGAERADQGDGRRPGLRGRDRRAGDRRRGCSPCGSRGWRRSARG